jgi:FAD/FMN-containing dehydrogenase
MAPVSGNGNRVPRRGEPGRALADGLIERGFKGPVLTPSHPTYEQERSLFNAMIEKRPSLIAKVTGAEDVAAAIRFARDRDLPLAARSGGHSVAGHSLVQDGLVIDVRLLKSIEIDPDKREARVGAGVTWGEFDRANQRHGLATTGGRVTTTGVAGYTLGGGNGWLDRSFGLAVDNLLSVDLVTADGRIVTASADDNPELFWALRGGGGNFGVATSFRFRLFPVGTVYAGLFLFEAERAGEDVTRTYRDLMDQAPRELGGGVLWLYAPAEEFVPEHLHNRLTVGVVLCHVGDLAEGERYAGMLRAHKPDLDGVGPVPYADFNGSLDDPPGLRNYWTAEYLDRFDDAVLSTFVEHSLRIPAGTHTQSAMLPYGGAVRDVGEDDTPLTGRHADWHLHPFCLWERPEDDDRCIGWARGIRAAMRPFATGAVHLNFIGDEGQDRVVAAYGRKKYERLARIKAEWDPDNVFRSNQNIRPEQTTGAATG